MRLQLSPAIRAVPFPGWATYPLLVVGDNTADEAGICVAERGHEAAQGLLVELSHCPEHSPARAAAGGAVPKAAHLLQPHDALHCVKRKADVGRAQDQESALGGWVGQRSGALPRRGTGMLNMKDFTPPGKVGITGPIGQTGKLRLRR